MNAIRKKWRRVRFWILKRMLTEEERRVIYGMRLGFEVKLEGGEGDAEG